MLRVFFCLTELLKLILHMYRLFLVVRSSSGLNIIIIDDNRFM